MFAFFDLGSEKMITHETPSGILFSALAYEYSGLIYFQKNGEWTEYGTVEGSTLTCTNPRFTEEN